MTKTLGSIQLIVARSWPPLEHRTFGPVTHSVSYDELQSYFLGFAWIVGNEVKGWDETQSRFEELGIKPVPVLRRRQFDDTTMKSVREALDLANQEGFVVGSVLSFADTDIATPIAKCVREGHVQSDIHWVKAEIIKNGLRLND